jgi:outer membrane protein assembly factor BamE (lipoprotein component of BamABCDE complex)
MWRQRRVGSISGGGRATLYRVLARGNCTRKATRDSRNPEWGARVGASIMTAGQMARHRGWRGLGVAIALACGLGACSPTISNSGFVMDEEALAQIHPGGQNREQVAQMLGSPSSVAVFDDQTWLYIHRRTSQRLAFTEPRVIDQDVVAITFDRTSGQVAEVRRLTLADGQAIAPVDRITPSPGKELTIMEQLLGNLGRFNPNQNRAER